MNNKLEQANTLVAQNKYKKALLLLRKIKPATYESIGLEIICLFNEQNYQLAKIKMELALKLASSEEQTLSVLNNLASVSEQLKQPKQAMLYLKRILEIDSSFNTAAQRMSLLKTAFSSQDFVTVEQYAPLLITLSEYSLVTLLILANSAIKRKENNQALHYLSRIDGEIRTDGGLKLDQQHIIHLLNAYDEIEAYKKKQSLLNFLEPKFKHESWFNEIQTRTFKQQPPQNSIPSNNNVEPNQHLKSKTSESRSSKESVIGNTRQTVELIIKLKKALEKMGAIFHPELTIVEQDGDIVVRSRSSNINQEQYMDVPLICMPLVNDYRFSIDENGNLCTQPKKVMLNPQAAHIMMILTDMFNSCNKLQAWRHTYPLFALSGFDNIVNKLLTAKSSALSYIKYYASTADQITNNAIISSFFSSRVFNFTSANLRQVGIKSKNKNEMGFIPIIELANHKMGTCGFETDIKSQSLKAYATPGEANRELFVQYNLDDPLVTLLTYGFVDTSAPWIYTVPAVLKTRTGLSLEVQNHMASIAPKEIPNHLSGLAHYLPANVLRKNNKVHISKLVIPDSKNQQSLRVVLAYILKKVDLEGFYLNPLLLEQEIESLELQLLLLNQRYWTELNTLVQAQLNANPPVPSIAASQLTELCEFCLQHIQNHIDQSATMLKN
jgi:tetratricopeptide (TPR) repeat protein